VIPEGAWIGRGPHDRRTSKDDGPVDPAPKHPTDYPHFRKIDINWDISHVQTNSFCGLVRCLIVAFIFSFIPMPHLSHTFRRAQSSQAWQRRGPGSVEGPHYLWSSKLEDHCHRWIFTSSKRYNGPFSNHRLGFGGAIVSYFHCNPHIWRIDMATMLKSEHPIQLSCDGRIKMFRKLRQWCDKVDTDVLVCMTNIIRSKR
jgi:hypothetical protein